MTRTSTTPTRYIGLFIDGFSTTQSLVQQRVPQAGTLTKFMVRLNSDPDVDDGEGYVFTVHDSSDTGADGTVTCTIEATETVCMDDTNSEPFAADALISIVVTEAGTDNLDPVDGGRWTALFTPTP